MTWGRVNNGHFNYHNIQKADCPQKYERKKKAGLKYFKCFFFFFSCLRCSCPRSHTWIYVCFSWSIAWRNKELIYMEWNNNSTGHHTCSPPQNKRLSCTRQIIFLFIQKQMWTRKNVNHWTNLRSFSPPSLFTPCNHSNLLDPS